MFNNVRGGAYLPLCVMYPDLIFVTWEIKGAWHKESREPQPTCHLFPHSGLCKTLWSRNSLLPSCVFEIYLYIAASAISRGGEGVIYLLTKQSFFFLVSIYLVHLIRLGIYNNILLLYTYRLWVTG